MRERLAEADERITTWMTHTNEGVVAGVLIWFALIVVLAALVS